MHLSARLRVPLAGFALCSTALLISACGGSSGSDSKKVPTTAVAVVGTETVPKTKLDTLLAQVCVQYKAAKKTCPKPGTAALKQLQQSFVAQLVQQAEFDVAGKQLKVAVKQKDVDSSLQKLELQYAKGDEWQGRPDQVEEGPHGQPHHRGERARQHQGRPPAAGHLRQADEERHGRRRGGRRRYYNKNKKTYAKPASRAIRHILVKDKALADKIYAQLATSDAQFSALAKKYTIDPGSKKNGGKLGSIQKGQTVPTFDKVAFSIPTGKVSKPVKSSYGWHVIEATGDTVPASQRPLDKALTSQIRTSLLTTKKQSVANKWFTTFQKKIEKTVRYATGFAPAKTTSTAASTAATARPRPADAALGSRTGSERRPARRRPAGRLRREQRLGQQRAHGRRRGRGRPEHHGRGSRDHDEHRPADAQDVVPGAGHAGLGLAALARARVARARSRVARLGAQPGRDREAERRGRSRQDHARRTRSRAARRAASTRPRSTPSSRAPA